MLTIASRIDAMNRLGRAMSDPTRSRILLALLEAPGYPGVLARDLELTRSNVSNHLTCLRGCGIVIAEPEGRRTRYEIADPHLITALRALLDVTLAVDDASAITRGEEGFYLLDATVEVEQLGDSAFSLTVVDTETHTELLPKGPDDEARCTASDGNERIQAASQVLADVLREDDAEQREELRLQWGASPAVWWGIQRTAIALVDTDGDSAGDFLVEACGPYLE